MGCGPQSDAPEPTSESTIIGSVNAAVSADVSAIAGGSRVVDLTVLVSETLPAHWGANPPFARWTSNWFEGLDDQYGTPATPNAAPYYS